MQHYLLIDSETGRGFGASESSAPAYRPAPGEVACTPEQAADPGGWVLVEGALVAYTPPPPSAEELIAYSVARRFAVETGGLDMEGVRVATDRESQARIASVLAYLRESEEPSLRFKGRGGWLTLTLDQARALALAVGAHVQACFAVEDALEVAITAVPPTVTTRAEIDAAYAPLAA